MDEVIKLEIKDKLLELRKVNHLSQEALANKLGISRQAISKWESGASFPDLENLIELSRLYEVSLDYLMKASDFEKKEDEKKKESNY